MRYPIFSYFVKDAIEVNLTAAPVKYITEEWASIVVTAKPVILPPAQALTPPLLLNNAAAPPKKGADAEIEPPIPTGVATIINFN